MTDVRGHALTYLVGHSRAYLEQLHQARRELDELQEQQLGLVLQAMDAAEVAVRAVNDLGTATLKTTPGLSCSPAP